MQHVCLSLLSIITKQKRRVYYIPCLVMIVFACCTVATRRFLLYFAPDTLLGTSDDRFGEPLIIVITPTHRRKERIADVTRLSQTLSLVKNLHWIVVEDANRTYPYIENILERSKIPFHYLYTTTESGRPWRGWMQRNLALSFIREQYAKTDAVVYFGDDDNTYDYRLFDRYIRKVKGIGLWAVGLVGSAMVEAPRVRLGKIIGWDVVYEPHRRYATDMAGFAVNLKEIIRVNASFRDSCAHHIPEICYLKQFKLPISTLEPFGYNDDPKEILVWHTKTRNLGTAGSSGGYLVEKNRVFSQIDQIWHEERSAGVNKY